MDERPPGTTRSDGSDRRESCDRGFTLIEVLLVVVMVGVVTAAVASAVTVTLRHTPPTEVRADDARSVHGLVTWLPQDVDATPPNGFDRGHATWPCAETPAVGLSHNVLTAEWSERTSYTVQYAASYRYERDDGVWALYRYTCDDNGSGTMGSAVRIKLTSALPEWDPANPPTTIEMCSAAVAPTAACAAADIIPASIAKPDADVNGFSVASLRMSVTRSDGALATIDAAPKNPDQDLADDPAATSNASPSIALPENHVHQMFAGETVTLDLATSHNPTDADGDPISVALDSTEPIPPGLTVSTSDPLNLEITTDPTMVAGTITDKIVLIVSDNRAGWIDLTVQVEILPQPNVAPTLSTPTYHLEIEQGETIVLPLEPIHGVFDANGDTVTASVIVYPVVPLASAPSLGSPGPLDLEIDATGGASLGPTFLPIRIRYDDGNGGTVDGTITVDVVAPSVNHPPTATTATHTIDMYADDSANLFLDITHGVSDPDGDVLDVSDVDDPSGVATTLNGGLGITVTTDPGVSVGPLAGPIELEVRDPNGDTLFITIDVRIIPTPEPPSDCVLQSLSAAPGVVDRQGNGGQPHLLKKDVTITITYSGSCDGLALNYDTGDTSGLGTNRVFPAGSPATVVVYGHRNGGTEKWTPGIHTITASTTSDVSPNSLSVDLEVT